MFSAIPDVATLLTSSLGITAEFAIPIGAMAAFWGARRLTGLVRGFFGG